MKITLKEYALNTTPDESYRLIAGMLELAVKYGASFNVEIPPSALDSNNRHVLTVANDAYAPFLKSMDKEELPSLLCALTAHGGEIFLTYASKTYMFPGTPGDVVAIWNEALLIDTDDITGVLEEQKRLTMLDMHQEIDEVLAQYNERARRVYKEGDLVILPNGIAGTAMTMPLYCKVHETRPEGQEWMSERDPDKYNLKLATMDQSKRLIFIFSHSGRVIPAE